MLKMVRWYSRLRIMDVVFLKSMIANIFTGGYVRQAEIADGRKGNAGIGLSVCATIVKAHGGSIAAVNRSTGGACFRITLDLEEGEADEK